jgi:hypothetical protein
LNRLGLGFAGLSLLACSGLYPPPQVTNLQVSPDACGRWTATIDASGHDDPLELRQDGKAVQSWQLTGQQTLTAQGGAGPGQSVTFEAQSGDSTVTSTVTMPPLDASVMIVPNEAVFSKGAPLAFDVSLSSPCPAIPPSTFDVRVLDAADQVVWENQHNPFGPNLTHFTIPPLPERGRYSVDIDGRAADLPLTPAHARIYVGNVDDDLDRDGVVGALDGPDCDDHDRNVNPERGENPLANGKDDNCDGRVDEGTTAYDDDGDGVCEDDGDCNDVDPGVHPGAAEIADCRDQDCDKEVDEGVELIAADDSFEPDDSRERAVDLGTASQHSFTRTITFVTRDPDDDEWVRFFSDDGDWDSWGIDVTVDGLPVGSTYEVEVYGAGKSPRESNRVREEGGAVYVTGAAFRDDSGDYFLHVDPVAIDKPWCPVTVTVWSR